MIIDVVVQLMIWRIISNFAIALKKVKTKDSVLKRASIQLKESTDLKDYEVVFQEEIEESLSKNSSSKYDPNEFLLDVYESDEEDNKENNVESDLEFGKDKQEENPILFDKESEQVP